jgi:transposase-like protein
VAHSPEVKAAVVADLLTGLSATKAATKHGVSKGIVIKWSQELNPENRPEELTKSDRSIPEEIRQYEFDRKLEEFLSATIGMLQAWAKECSDPKFIRENPTGVNTLGASVLDRAERILSNIRDTAPTTPSGGPEKDGLP